MGRFLEAERATWYLGGGSSIVTADGVRAAFLREDSVLGFDEEGAGGVGTASARGLWAVVRDGFFRADWVSGCDVGEAGGKTSSAFFVAGEAFARWEGRSGLGSGGCALSDSVMASAAARSAARAASCGVVGAAGGACDGAVGFEGVAEVDDGSAYCQFSN
jgi:hypothetical protein